MKVIEMDCEFYLYPKGINNLEELKTFFNENFKSFISLKRINDAMGVFPHFIEEEVEDTIVNVSNISNIYEREVSFIKREEYIKKLKKLASVVCKDCLCYGDECMTEKIETYIDKLCLDGECDFKEEE